ncbi:glycosyltransferase family 2 protein [Nocardioides guangzhouensis]|uniref:Glycosyltransferase family 2 protein n=1 Tax=Nocardioides guangzhouensis TaxID=2497878 RepID=A0A4Q4ZDY8_9ACTN|nr:CDP-glycerol glycerophosphotransferase family protein [Nocardioides guangzhouensis]RYP85394.1 glycosyltransferase family 2 protein [Nocardioides guangzhouensis]
MPKLTEFRRRTVVLGRRGARRVARSRAGQRLLRRLRRPAVSIIVPFYNVEQYLAACLDSVLGQSLGDFEVLLVDDSSPDGSRAIAERYAAGDGRIRIITRENGGLGAARNTGVAHARGRYLTFLDSDDLLPADALQVLVASADSTGSDIVAGSMERFSSERTWMPEWVDDVHSVARPGIRIDDFLPLLRNLYTCNKLFRHDFWTSQALSFREGVAYEDQPLVTQLFARARSIDVLTDIVYSYRARDDKSSISQQTASLKDLRDRIAAWHLSRDAFRRELSPAAYQGWLATLFEAHFQWYLVSPGTVDDTYWNELVAAVQELTADADERAWQWATPPNRVLVRLAQQDRRAEAQEFVRRRGRAVEDWPATVRDDGIALELPFSDDPDLDPELFVVRPEQVRISHAVENVHWISRPGGVPSLWMSGWAYLRKVDLSTHDATVTVILRDEATGRDHEFTATGRPDASFPPPRDDKWCDYRPGVFGVELPLSDLLSDAKDGSRWSVWLRVEAAGLRATRPVSHLVRSGSAGVIPASPLPGGGRLIAGWKFRQPLHLVVDRSGVPVHDVTLEGRTLTARLGSGGHGVAGIVVSTRGQVLEVATHGSSGRTTFRADLPVVETPEPGQPVEWAFVARLEDGRTASLVVETGSDNLAEATSATTLVAHTGRNSDLQVTEWSLGAVADHVELATSGELTVSGRVFGPGVQTVGIATLNKRARAAGDPVALTDQHFTASVGLRQEVYRFGQRPLPTGDHDLRLRVDRGGSVVEIPVLVSHRLSDDLPVRVSTEDHDGRVVRGPERVVRVHLDRPIGDARGRYQQNRLRMGEGARTSLTRGVLMRSYFGEQATDNGVSIQKELRRRGSDLPVYWAVQDRSVPVPDGGIPVVVNTTEWYQLLGSVQYYVDNMYQPEYHRKPEGQVIAQTFHGYPFKRMGHPHWQNLQVSRSRIAEYDARAAEWDYLVSPARYATPLLVRDFAYRGEVLEIGYPRNDVLQSPEADDLRARTRASLGVAEGQTAVLYAPTFRDYLAEGDSKAVLADFFDFAEATRALGDDYVILVRGHAYHARSSRRVGSLPGCVDVTDYPEVSDLYLAADAGIVDYSSLRFDFGVTGKPMVFHVPDLQRYNDTRGWLFDFEPTAPGPLVDSTAEVVDHLRDLDGLRTEYAAAYDTFRKDYLDLEDGHAGERFVDAVFVPRGDA